MSFPEKDLLRDLIEGKLSDKTIKEIMSKPKDSDRFTKYVEILQEKVKWPERILLPIGLHLFIVQKGRDRIVKCDCGHEFGDFRINWKLNSLIYVRDTVEKLDEIFPGKGKGVRPDLYELREFFCPGCGVLLEVECVPPCYPITFDFLPDVDTFYREWLGQPLEYRQTFEDRTDEVIAVWAKGA